MIWADWKSFELGRLGKTLSWAAWEIPSAGQTKKYLELGRLGKEFLWFVCQQAGKTFRGEKEVTSF